MRIPPTTCSSEKTPRKKHGGWLLMEVIIALSLFSMAVVAYVIALNNTSKLALLTQQEARINIILEGVLIEAATLPELEETKYEYTFDEFNMRVQVEVQPIQLQNKDGEELNDMWQITVNAQWLEDGQFREETFETWRYAKMYLP